MFKCHIEIYELIIRSHLIHFKVIAQNNPFKIVNFLLIYKKNYVEI